VEKSAAQVVKEQALLDDAGRTLARNRDLQLLEQLRKTLASEPGADRAPTSPAVDKTRRKIGPWTTAAMAMRTSEAPDAPQRGNGTCRRRRVSLLFRFLTDNKGRSSMRIRFCLGIAVRPAASLLLGLFSATCVLAQTRTTAPPNLTAAPQLVRVAGVFYPADGVGPAAAYQLAGTTTGVVARTPVGGTQAQAVSLIIQRLQ